MTTFVDTNVLIAVLNPKEPHHQWSLMKLQERKLDGPVIVSDIVYCEFSVGMNTKEAVDSAISELALERLPENDEVLFRAGIAFKHYRKNRGQAKNVLPDFFIGAMAEVVGAPILTANEKDILKYFPRVKTISP